MGVGTETTDRVKEIVAIVQKTINSEASGSSKKEQEEMVDMVIPDVKNPWVKWGTSLGTFTVMCLIIWKLFAVVEYKDKVIEQIHKDHTELIRANTKAFTELKAVIERGL